MANPNDNGESALVLGDLTRTGKLTSYGQETSGDTAAPPTGTFEQIFAHWQNPPALPTGMPEKMQVVGFRDTREGPVWKRTWQLRGTEISVPKWGGSTMKPRTKENPIFRLQTTLEEAPISTHPNIKALIKKYAGKTNPDGTVEFPPFYTAAAGGGGLAADQEGQGNPLWGTTTYRAVRMMFSARYFLTKSEFRSWGQNIIDRAGTIDTPKNGAPSLKGGRTWLHLGASIEISGDMYAVEESWLASEPGGWLSDIYSASALGGGK